MPFRVVYGNEQAGVDAAREAGRAAGLAARQREEAQAGRAQAMQDRTFAQQKDLETQRQTGMSERQQRQFRNQQALAEFDAHVRSMPDERKAEEARKFASLVSNPDFVERFTGLDDASDPGAKKRLALRRMGEAASRDTRTALMMLPIMRKTLEDHVTGNVSARERMEVGQQKILDTAKRVEEREIKKEEDEKAEKARVEKDKAIKAKEKELATLSDSIAVKEAEIEEHEATRKKNVAAGNKGAGADRGEFGKYGMAASEAEIKKNTAQLHLKRLQAHKTQLEKELGQLRQPPTPTTQPGAAGAAQVAPAPGAPLTPEAPGASEITATGPNGEKIVLRNGQWVPLQ